MRGKQSRRAVLRHLATGSIVGSTALGAIGLVSANQGNSDGQGKPTVRVGVARFTTVVIQYPRKGGPTVHLEIRDAETEELVDEWTLEPGAYEVTGYPEGEYEAIATVANAKGKGNSSNAIEVVGSPFRTIERSPPSCWEPDDEDGDTR